MMRPTLFVFCACFLFVANSQGRRVPNWSYDQLFEKADLVVIVDVVTNKVTGDIFKQRPEDNGAGYVGVNTEFKICRLLKGEPNAKAITVLHFRHVPGSAYSDGILVVNFRLSGWAFNGEIISKKKNAALGRISFETGKPEYLLFLKQRNDGRYEPVTGQYDAALSCREVTQPRNLLPDEDEYL